MKPGLADHGDAELGHPGEQVRRRHAGVLDAIARRGACLGQRAERERQIGARHAVKRRAASNVVATPDRLDQRLEIRQIGIVQMKLVRAATHRARRADMRVELRAAHHQHVLQQLAAFESRSRTRSSIVTSLSGVVSVTPVTPCAASCRLIACRLGRLRGRRARNQSSAS
jgi:hypothetical protein